jgi:transcription factor E
VVEDLINKQATPIIDLLLGKKHVNEFSIAKKLDLTINQTRNILYRLSDYGLVSFIRKKDKRKGWYIYFWTLNVHQSLSFLEGNLKKHLKNLKEQLKSRKEKRFYICDTCSIEVSEESALLNDFSCPECEEIYELSSSANLTKSLEKTIKKIEKEIVFVSEERKKEHEKLEKKKAKEIKKIEADKKEKRDAKRKANKIARDKLAKKMGVTKKVAKKKGKKKVKKGKKKVAKKSPPKGKKKVAKKVKTKKKK